MNTKLNFLMALTLLLGLVYSSPAQNVMAASATAIFTFTSSLNPSRLYQEVTFTLSATDSDPAQPYPPFGYVYFYDNGNPIGDCPRGNLNFQGSMPVADSPAVCTTRLTTPGTHTITAWLDSMLGTSYDATLTLEGGQTVNESYPLTISPETLPDGVYGEYFKQLLSAACSAGVECGAVRWTASGKPQWMDLYDTTGQLSGTPQAAGAFTFTVEANDHIGSLGSRTYTWNVLKATPVVTIDSTDVSGGMISLRAYVKHPILYKDPQLAGSVSFSVDGTPVEGCSGASASQLITSGYADCYTNAPAGLQAGSHSVQADFTPEAASSANYNSASGTGTVMVYAKVAGLLFNDLDRDGVRDAGEGPLTLTWVVGLDQGCDGISEYTADSSNITGQFSFETAIPGATYCLVVARSGNWGPSTVLQPFIPEQEITFEIGLYFTEVTISPAMLPDGTMNVPYSQVFSATGGEGLYTFTMSSFYSRLPDGLVLSTDGTLSGTPTLGGGFYMTVQAEDANHAVGSVSYVLAIITDGTFTLTSSPNPSAPSEAVTFTLSGTGEAYNYYWGSLMPPYGKVTFQADGVDIPGCINLWLSYADQYGIVHSQPAVCTTSALGAGSHEITALYKDLTGYFHDATVTLEGGQTVAKPPAFYSIAGTIFEDINKDGLFDAGEPLTGLSWTVNLDQDCDGTIDQTAVSSGSYEFTSLPEGRCYRLSVGMLSDWWQTRPLADIPSLSQDITNLDIGVYPVYFVIPSDLPAGDIGMPYSHQYHATGGTAPFSFALIDNAPGQPSVLPEGLTLTQDGLLSGTPTQGGVFMVVVQATDANGAVSMHRHEPLVITLDGDFRLTSSINPSNAGDYVTFTLSATGSLVHPDLGPTPPLGFVVFQEDGVPIPGCTNVPLNIQLDQYGNPAALGNYPASCSVAPLAVGTHTITAAFTNVASHWYHNATLTLGQEVTSFYVVSKLMLPEPSLAGYPIIRTYVLFTGPGVQEDYACTVDYGDGTVQTGRVESRPPDEFICSDELSTSHIYQDAGSYTLTFKVTNLTSGKEIAPTLQHAVVADTDPGYISWSPDPVVENQPVTFSAPPAFDSYTWYLVSGPGIESPAVAGVDQAFAYTFSSSGTYKLMLTLGYRNMETGDIDFFVDGVEVTVHQAADLSITKTDRKDPVKPGARLIYTLMVSNAGPNTAESITLQDTLDRNTTFVLLSAPSGWTCNYASYKVICTNASLASGSSATITITVTVNKTAKIGKELVNNASVSSTTYDPNLANNNVVQKTMVLK